MIHNQIQFTIPEIDFPIRNLNLNSITLDKIKIQMEQMLQNLLVACNKKKN